MWTMRTSAMANMNEVLKSIALQANAGDVISVIGAGDSFYQIV